MPDIWFTSDHHFFHSNILKFVGDNGKLIRPGFADVEDMNEYMVQKWNSVVKPQDKVWHLGDIAFKVRERRKDLATLLHRLNGRKRLVIGNHDDLPALLAFGVFEKVELWRGFHDQGFTCSHIPLRLESLRDGQVCVHGHIHQNTMSESGYVNVCVEVRDYTPVHMDQLIVEVKKQTEALQYEKDYP